MIAPLSGLRSLIRSKLFLVGLALLFFGSGPLIAVISLDAVGLWPDPNPNPIGFGLLAMVTFPPGMLCVILGAARAGMRKD